MRGPVALFFMLLVVVTVIELVHVVDGPLTPVSYAEAVKNGHAYVSYGPLIEPAVMFGSELKVKPGVPFPLAFSLRSVTGLRQVKLIGAGTVAFTQVFNDAPREARVEFKPTATGHTWYSLEVEDVAGLKAYSNPIWVEWPVAEVGVGVGVEHDGEVAIDRFRPR